MGQLTRIRTAKRLGLNESEKMRYRTTQVWWNINLRVMDRIKPEAHFDSQPAASCCIRFHGSNPRNAELSYRQIKFDGVSRYNLSPSKAKVTCVTLYFYFSLICTSVLRHAGHWFVTIKLPRACFEKRQRSTNRNKRMQKNGRISNPSMKLKDGNQRNSHVQFVHINTIRVL